MSLIIGEKYTDEIRELTDLGYEVITFKAPRRLSDEIAFHSDISFFNFRNEALFINSDLKGEIGEEKGLCKPVYVDLIQSPYPDEVKLNCALIGDILLCNRDYACSELLVRAEERGVRVIHTNQGYSKCSTCILNDKAVITDDDGIACLLKNCQIDVLQISKGYVHLSDRHYGFIGGASGMLNDSVLYFSGDISSHPDYDQIAAFLDKYHIKPVFNKNRVLNDFGGFINI